MVQVPFEASEFIRSPLIKQFKQLSYPKKNPTRSHTANVLLLSPNYNLKNKLNLQIKLPINR